MAHRGAHAVKSRVAITCPTCKRRFYVAEDAVRDHPTMPFCSKRCRAVDLGKWLEEGYRISEPIEPSDLEDGDSSPSPD